MKKITFIVAALFVAASVFAQDVIVTKDSRRINAKVTEVNVDNIRYKQFDNQDGPVYTLPKSDIVTILYQNGTVENYGAESSPAVTSAVTPAPAPPAASSATVKTPVPASSVAQWGVRGGLNMAQETVGDESSDMRAGIHLGFFMEKAISKGVDFQLEFIYSMKGATYKITQGGKTHTDKIDYIDIPLMFKIYVNKNRRFSIDVGPQLGYMVSFKYNDGSKTSNVYNSDELNKFEASLCIGVSYKVSDKFDLIFRGTGSLTKVVKDTDIRNSVAQLGIGYRF